VRAESDTINYAGRPFAKMHGYNAKELMGAPLNILLSGDRGGELQTVVEVLSKKGHAALETASVRKDGSIFSAELRVHLVRTRRDDRAFARREGAARRRADGGGGDAGRRASRTISTT
jgi:PAS domain S-box-containing protein